MKYLVDSTKGFGILVRRARKKNKLTQTALAAVSGVGARFVRELEKGKTTCQIGKALLVAQRLGIKFEMELP